MNLNPLANITRFKDIVVTLIKYGFQDVVDRMDLPTTFTPGVKAAHTGEQGTYERIRLVLEELGPTFIKLGQIASLRPDLLPYNLAKELSLLQDQVTPAPFSQIKAVVDSSMPNGLNGTFSSFDEKPLAAASLAQVHRAVLRDEEIPVAVKVLKAGIKEAVETDLELLEYFADLLDGRLDVLECYDLPGIIQEMERTLTRELNFIREAQGMIIAEKNLGENRWIRIPKVYENYTTERVLTMELIKGRKIAEIPSHELQGFEEMAVEGLRATIKQILEDGFFHADPHPGNLLIMENNVMALLDWGMVGRLTRSMRYDLIDLINAIVERDSEAVVDVLMGMTRSSTELNLRAVEREILDIMDAYMNMSVSDVNMGQILSELTSLLRRQEIRVPPDFAVMIKSLITIEGTARMLYPELNVAAEAEPFVRALAMERYRPKALLKELRKTLKAGFNLQKNLPRRLSGIFNKLDRGEFSVRFRHENISGLISTMEAASNRLAFALIIAALIIGSSLIITTGITPLVFGYPALGVLGFVISGVLGLWLVINMIRKRKL